MNNSFSSLLFSFLVLLLFANCSEGTKETKTETEAPKVLPSISFEEMKKLHDETDFIDIIYYNFDFSMSVNAKTNIKRMVGMVSPNAANLNPNCQAMGRIFFQKNGNLLIEADMYFDKQCRYFVFQKDGKPAYANDLTPEGQAYFTKIFSQVKVEPTK